jgi:hypothetical protein
MTSSHIYEINQHPSFYEGIPHVSINNTGKPFTPYVYKISWISRDIHYIGSSYRAGCHPSYLFNRRVGTRGYFTSSPHVKQYIERFGDPDGVIILAILTDTPTTLATEHAELVANDTANSPKYLNRSNGSAGYYKHKSGFVIVKHKNDPNGKYFCVHQDCYDLSLHDTPGTGKVSVVDTVMGESISVPVEKYWSDDRYVSNLQDRVIVIDSELGITRAVPTNDYHSSDRYTSVSKDWVPAIHKITGESVRVTTEAYHNNKDIYTHSGIGRVVAIDTLTDTGVKITTDEFHSNQDRYTTATTGLVFVTSIQTDEPMLITSDEYTKTKINIHVTILI